MRFLITGGAGFIGSTLVNRLSDDNEIVIVDDLSMGDEKNISNIEKSNISFIHGSVTDKSLMEDLFQNRKFDYIFHLAAVASVADSVERPVQTHEVNFESTLTILELCRTYQPDLKRLVFSSSAAVYGDEPTLPKKEESVICPLTPYAVDKFASERYCLNYHLLYGVPTSAVRFFNVYGPNQNPSSPYSGVLSILTDRYQKCLGGEDAKFTIFGNGEQTRDFIYIEDVINALILVSESEDSKGRVFNVGTGNATSINDVIEIYNKYVGKDIEIDYKEARKGDIKHSLANIDALSDLGFKLNNSIVDGITKYLASVLVENQ